MLQKLREAREVARNAILRLRDVIAKENRDFNTEERAEWDKANKDYDAIGRQIEVLERGEAVEKVQAKRAGDMPGSEDTDMTRPRTKGEKRRELAEATEEARALAMQAWFLRQLDMPLTDKHKRACKLLNFRPGMRSLTVNLPRRPGETRAQSVGTNSAGGYTVPTGFITSLEVALKEWNAVRQVADVMRTDDGRPLPWPTINDTGVAGELLAENTAAADGDMTFGQTTFNAYKFSSKMVKVSAELLEDNAVDLANEIGGLLGERIGRTQETYLTTGTGSSQPGGVVTGSTLGVTAASAAAIAADELISLLHSVDPAYRRDPSCGFMMHDNIAAAVRKLKDSQNRYLWDMDALKNGQPAMLLGKPVTINQSMQSSIATGTKTVLFGAYKKFKIRDVKAIRIRRLTERYADADQEGFIAFMRTDAKLLNAGTNPIKHLIQA